MRNVRTAISSSISASPSVATACSAFSGSTRNPPPDPPLPAGASASRCAALSSINPPMNPIDPLPVLFPAGKSVPPSGIFGPCSGSPTLFSVKRPIVAPPPRAPWAFGRIPR